MIISCESVLHEWLFTLFRNPNIEKVFEDAGWNLVRNRKSNKPKPSSHSSAELDRVGKGNDQTTAKDPRPKVAYNFQKPSDTTTPSKDDSNNKMNRPSIESSTDKGMKVALGPSYDSSSVINRSKEVLKKTSGQAESHSLASLANSDPKTIRPKFIKNEERQASLSTLDSTMPNGVGSRAASLLPSKRVKDQLKDINLRPQSGYQMTTGRTEPTRSISSNKLPKGYVGIQTPTKT